MKECELREAATCAACGDKIGASGLPLFWRVTLERWGVLLDAVRRQAGAEMMMGSVAIAQVLGPNEDMAKRLGDPETITVCESCAEPLHVILELVRAHRARAGTRP